MNSDREVKGDHRGYMTARDALVFASIGTHGDCTVVLKGKVRDGKIAFKCACKTTYVVGASQNILVALRNVPEDKKL